MAENGKQVQLSPWSAPATIVPAPTAAPTPGGKATLVVGAVRDARAVGIQIGDLTIHVNPAEARTIAAALYISAKAIDLLLADDKGTISLG